MMIRQVLRICAFAKRCAAAACCAMSLLGCLEAPRGAEWRAQQEPLIAETVLRDLAIMPPVSAGDVRSTICIAVGPDMGEDISDPSPQLLDALRMHGMDVYPDSECELRGTMHHVNRGKALQLGCSTPEWRGDGFVRVRGWQYVSPVASKSWSYTLSLTRDGWKVDTAKIEAIS